MPNDFDDEPRGPQNRIDHGQLKQYKQRFVRLEEEKKDIADQQKELLSELKSEGYNATIFKRVVKITEMDQKKRFEEEAEMEMYLEAIQ